MRQDGSNTSNYNLQVQDHNENKGNWRLPAGKGTLDSNLQIDNGVLQTPESDKTLGKSVEYNRPIQGVDVVS